MPQHRLPIWMTALALLTGCGLRPTEPVISLARFTDSLHHQVAVGGSPADVATSAGQIGLVLAAQIDSLHNQIVVLDISPPFIRLFGNDGAPRGSFVGKGGGEGEAEQPVSIAMLGDSVLLLAEFSGRMTEFSLQGRVLAQGSFPSIHAMAATGVCGNRWLFYTPGTPSISSGSQDRLPWLQTLPMGLAVLEPKVVFRDLALRNERYGFGGKPYGLTAVAGGALLGHQYGPSPRILRWPCNDGEKIESLAPLPASGKYGMASPSGAREVPISTSSLPKETAMGSGVLTSGLVIATAIMTGSSQEQLQTRLTLLRQGRAVSIVVDGMVTIRDSRPGVGLLVAVSDPIPRLILFSEDDLNSLFAVK